MQSKGDHKCPPQAPCSGRHVYSLVFRHLQLFPESKCSFKNRTRFTVCFLNLFRGEKEKYLPFGQTIFQHLLRL